MCVYVYVYAMRAQILIGNFMDPVNLRLKAELYREISLSTSQETFYVLAGFESTKEFVTQSDSLC